MINDKLLQKHALLIMEHTNDVLFHWIKVIQPM